MKENGPDITLYVLAIIAGIVGIFYMPETLVFLFFLAVAMFFVVSSGKNERDEYHKAKKELKWVVLFVGGFCFLLYLMLFKIMKIEAGAFHIIVSFLLFIVGVIYLRYFKRAYPVRFLQDDERFVQEKMYDYIEGDLDASFAHRVLKSMKLPNKPRAYPTLVTTKEINHIAYDELKGVMPLGVQKAVIEILNEGFSGGKNNDYLIKSYGYCFNVLNKDIDTIEKFETFLKEFSHFYFMVYTVITTELKSVKKELNYKQIKEQHKGIVELMMLAMLHAARYYKNVPAGNMGGALFKKDRNNYIANLWQYHKDRKIYTQNYALLAAIYALPSDIKDVTSTTVGAAGVAIYFGYYKINEEFFQNHTEEEIIKKWVKIYTKA